jgi:hypothetical protein
LGLFVIKFSQRGVPWRRMGVPTVTFLNSQSSN